MRSATTVALWAALLIGVIAVSIWRYLASRRRQVARPVAVAAALDMGVGLVAVALGLGHLIGVIGVAIRRSEPFAYDFHFASLLLVGLVVVASGALCVAATRRLGRGRRDGWRLALVGAVLLIAFDAPLVPIQFFAVLLAALGFVNALVLIKARASTTA